MVIQCCVCKRVRRAQGWLPMIAGEKHRQDISHGYCPECAAQAFAEIRRATAGPFPKPHHVAMA